jgi:ribosomal protein S18 acetylase RimI-like enzyme
MKIEIRSPQDQSEWDAYYAIRYDELRKPWGQAPGTEKDDKEAQALHYALFSNKRIAGVLRVDKTDLPHTLQFRFMAVSQKYQGLGFGELLMLHAEQEAKMLHTERILLHAREIALGFYEKLGYRIVSKSHLLFGEIQHFLMEKHLMEKNIN